MLCGNSPAQGLGKLMQLKNSMGGMLNTVTQMMGANAADLQEQVGAGVVKGVRRLGAGRAGHDEALWHSLPCGFWERGGRLDAVLRHADAACASHAR